MLLDAIEIETGANPTHAVIWLHGLGADGGDFAPMVPELKLQGGPPIRFVFPHAPKIPVSINGGFVMPAWYDIVGTELMRQEDEAGLRRSQTAIGALIQREKTRGIAPGKVVLAGFSQGCAMTLMTGLRYPERLAGLMALSGYLPLANQLQNERSMMNADVPIFMAHGTYDPVVPIGRARESVALLHTLGYDVTLREYSMPHSVCPQEIFDIGTWLNDILSR